MSSHNSIVNYYLNNPSIVLKNGDIKSSNIEHKKITNTFLFQNNLTPENTDVSLRVMNDRFYSTKNRRC